MQMLIEIPGYNPNEGLKSTWENNFEVTAKVEANGIVITANKEGLISLAVQLLTLAQDEIPAGHHFHYDEHNALEEGSTELVIQKK